MMSEEDDLSRWKAPVYYVLVGVIIGVAGTFVIAVMQ